MTKVIAEVKHKKIKLKISAAESGGYHCLQENCGFGFTHYADTLRGAAKFFGNNKLARQLMNQTAIHAEG